jgi:multiple sugar transport system permease protein
MAVTTAGEPLATEHALPKRRRHRAPGQDRLPTKIVVYAFLTIGSIIFMAPFAWMVIASFKHIQDIFAWPPQWVPHNPTINNYKHFLQAENVARWFFNSAFVTLTIITIQTVLSAMAAYCFAKRTFPSATRSSSSGSAPWRSRPPSSSSRTTLC